MTIRTARVTRAFDVFSENLTDAMKVFSPRVGKVPFSKLPSLSLGHMPPS
jgi:hypothetical protein